METFLEICMWLGKFIIAVAIGICCIPVMYLIPVILAVGVPILGAIGIVYMIYQEIKGRTRQS